ncbi:hypothetical protein E2542_SST05032 [Spatholobus suberectus]|nr:hypothetical protein E2542_SST05032 [Spatholobus suberectus]
MKLSTFSTNDCPFGLNVQDSLIHGMAAEKEEKKKEDIEVITAIYKVNLHCKECGSKIKKHLMITEEKKSKKKVELISPKVKPKEITTTDKKPKEIKDPIIRIISVKVHMHCDKCEADLKSRLIKHKGIFNVKTDQKAQSVTVEGTIEVEKLMSFLRKKVHKNAEIISIKEVKKEEKKGKEEGKSSETTKEKDHSKSGESIKKKDDNKSSESTKEKEGKSGESTKEKEGKSGESTTEKGDGKSSETTKIIETRQEHPKEIKDNVPYIIHYVYAPQLFSDENPNSCSIL